MDDGGELVTAVGEARAKGRIRGRDVARAASEPQELEVGNRTRELLEEMKGGRRYCGLVRGAVPGHVAGEDSGDIVKHRQ